MRDGIQTGFPNEELKKFGCYFFVLCRMAEYVSNNEFSDEDIITLFNMCKLKGWVGRNSWIIDPVSILNLMQTQKVYKSVSHCEKQPQAMFYPVYFKVNDNNTHFALGCNGEIVFDSWSPSAMERKMPLHSYRNIT